MKYNGINTSYTATQKTNSALDDFLESAGGLKSRLNVLTLNETPTLGDNGSFHNQVNPTY